MYKQKMKVVRKIIVLAIIILIFISTPISAEIIKINEVATTGNELISDNLETGNPGWDSENIGFRDLQGREWYRKNAERLLNDEREIIKGYPDGEFKGQNTLSVEQFVTMVGRALELDVREALVGEHWSAPYIEAAIESNIIKETDFNDYKKGISRAEMSSIIINAVEVLDGEKAESIDGINSLIKDLNNIKYEYQDSVKKVYSLGIITGYNDGTFGGDKILNRAEVATVVVRIIDKTERVDVQAAIEVAEGDMSAYMYGESLWVNPLESDWEEIIDMQVELVGESNYNVTGNLSYFPTMRGGEPFNVSSMAEHGYLEIHLSYNLDGGLITTTVEKIESNLNDSELLLGTRLNQKELKIAMDYLRKRDTSASLDGHSMQKKRITNTADAKNYQESFYFEEYVMVVWESYQNTIPGIVEKGGSTGTGFALYPRNVGKISDKVGAYGDLLGYNEVEEIIYSTDYVEK